MAKKSSLKTFLAGKNPYGGYQNFSTLIGGEPLFEVTSRDESFGGCWQDPNTLEWWSADVLDDGTVITYCMDN